MVGLTYRVPVRGQMFGRNVRSVFIDRGRIAVDRREMLGVEGKVIEHRIVLVDAFLVFGGVWQIFEQLWMPGHDMTSDKLCCLEWLAADGASALFGVVYADIGVYQAFVRWVTAV